MRLFNACCPWKVQPVTSEVTPKSDSTAKPQNNVKVEASSDVHTEESKPVPEPVPVPEPDWSKVVDPARRRFIRETTWYVHRAAERAAREMNEVARDMAKQEQKMREALQPHTNGNFYFTYENLDRLSGCLGQCIQRTTAATEDLTHGLHCFYHSLSGARYPLRWSEETSHWPDVKDQVRHHLAKAISLGNTTDWDMEPVVAASDAALTALGVSNPTINVNEEPTFHSPPEPTPTDAADLPACQPSPEREQ